MVSQVVAADGRRIPADSLERIERLDDTVFAALAGDAAALEAAGNAWRDARESIDARLLDEARQHYVRHARSRWQRSQSRPEKSLTVGFAALEVLDLLEGDLAPAA